MFKHYKLGQMPENFYFSLTVFFEKVKIIKQEHQKFGLHFISLLIEWRMIPYYHGEPEGDSYNCFAFPKGEVPLEENFKVGKEKI
jgi:hypothetical protein